MFKLKMQSWQCVEFSDANSVGWRHPELGEWEGNQEINFPFLSVTPFCPQEDLGPRIVACLFQLGKGGGKERRMPNNILGVLIFAKHLRLNCQFPTHLLVLASLSHSTSTLGSRGHRRNAGISRTGRYWEQGLARIKKFNGQSQICWSDLFETSLKSLLGVLTGSKRGAAVQSTALLSCHLKIPLWAHSLCP